MQITAKWIISVCLIVACLIFPETGLNARTASINQLADSLDNLNKGQTEIQNLIINRASKAGARRIIQMVTELTENKLEKVDLENAIQSLQKDLSNISNMLITLSSQVSPQHRIQILAEIKTEQQNIKERLSELSERVLQINTQYARNAVKSSQNRQADISKLVDKQSDINNIFSRMKQDFQDQKKIASRHLTIILCFFMLIIAGIAGCCYFYIKQQKREKAEILEQTQRIVKEQYDRLIEQLYIEEHEDGRLTADDLKKMSEQVKRRVIRQNWAKRKVEERPAFI
ncbi:conserved hypothetical protein, membrane [Candidatus Magnetomorum sp. HK-1]|nr:conserved hypothetical protein, membrane [Candidatus Magnetomorum sp. HK-1]